MIEEFKEIKRMCVHAFLLSFSVFRLIVRYGYVIFRDRVLELPISAQKLEAYHKATADEYVRVAMRLKGGTIKLGQYLSARADVVPRPLIESLKKLQDQVEAAPFSYVKKTIEKELGQPVESLFEWINPLAMAAASFGQVHQAKTKNHQSVVIKVLHLNIERTVHIDLFVFRFAVFFFDQLFPKFHVQRIYDEVSKITLAELDYRQEAKNAQRVQLILKDDNRVRIPRVYEDYSSKRVLCLEDIGGLSIQDPKLIERTGGSPRAVLEAVIGAYCQQIYVHGFFQSDPHPGNLFYYPPDPKYPQQALIGIIDFGQAKQISMHVHRSLQRAVMAIINKDLDGLMEALLKLEIIESADKDTVAKVLVRLGEHIQEGKVSEFMNIDYDEFAKTIVQALKDLEVVSIPHDLILYGRTMGLLQGLNFQLDKDLPTFKVVAPYLFKLTKS